MSKYLCLSCFEIYEKDSLRIDEFSEYIFCPKTNCIGEIVEVDELMIPVIIELNKKGYFTQYCCSGHFYGQHPNGYIMFKKDIDIPNIPKYFKRENNKKGLVIRSTIKHNLNIKPDYYDCFKIYKNAEILLKWAISLPYNQIKM